MGPRCWGHSGSEAGHRHPGASLLRSEPSPPRSPPPQSTSDHGYLPAEAKLTGSLRCGSSGGRPTVANSRRTLQFLGRPHPAVSPPEDRYTSGAFRKQRPEHPGAELGLQEEQLAGAPRTSLKGTREAAYRNTRRGRGQEEHLSGGQPSSRSDQGAPVAGGPPPSRRRPKRSEAFSATPRRVQEAAHCWATGGRGWAPVPTSARQSMQAGTRAVQQWQVRPTSADAPGGAEATAREEGGRE